MKKFLSIVLGLVLVIAVATVADAAKPTVMDSLGNEYGWESAPQACNTITQGEVFYTGTHYLAGEPIPAGFDVYGYNYQGHMFKGSYANVYLGGEGFPAYEGESVLYVASNPTVVGKWYWPYRDYDLQMKWNDAWIANTDCDGDDKLDRHYGYSSYKGSGAWETNQYGGDGWASLTKIVAVPTDAVLNGSYWFTSDGVEIGQSIWGEFAITQDVLSGEGALYVSPNGPGYGQY